MQAPHLQDFRLRLRALFSRREVERDLQDELAFHIEMQIRKNLAAGMTRSEAARQARLEFGGAAQVEEECRDARRIGLLETSWGDIRYAIRGFRRAPAFAATVVATIALGLGLVTALFTVLDAFYLRPLAVRDPHSLYEMFWENRSGAWQDFSWLQFRETTSQVPAFVEAFAFKRSDTRLDGRNISGILVSSEYFPMLGVGAALGRTLLPEDFAAPGREPVIVLSYNTWQHRFAADPHILGQTVPLRGRLFQVVGVAPEHFNGLGERPTDFWAPLTMSAAFDSGPDLFGPRQPAILAIVGRLRPGFTARQAQAAATVWTRHLSENLPATQRSAGVVLVSRATTKPFNPKNAAMFTLVLLAFTVVLLIGCTNVANMMLARSLSRQREIGVRLSLGASRGRLIRQLLTESLLLAIPAAITGLALSRGMIQLSVRVLLATLPPGIADFGTRIPDLAVDLRVFAFGFAAALLSAVLFGLAPSIEATRSNIIQATRGDLTGNLRPSRMRSLLVAGQVGVCVLVLITAAVLLRGIKQIGAMDSGLSTRDNLALTIGDPYRQRIVERLRSDPAVTILAAANSAPTDRKPVLPATPAEGGTTLRLPSNAVSPEYFPLFEIPLIGGRNFTGEEGRERADVAVVSQSAAQRLWPGRNPVGRSLRLGEDGRFITVVGVAHDEISRWLTNGEDKSVIYTPASANMAGEGLFVRPLLDPQTATRKLDSEISAIDPNALLEMHKLQIRAWVAEDTYSFQVMYWVSSAIGGLALILTLSGIYGVLSYAVSQRTKEIGIRMALGATSGGVTGLVLRQSLRLALFGLLAGGAAALVISRILASTLVMINTFDAAAYLGGVSLVVAACAAAAWLPARRASRIDPLITLRHD